MVERSRRSRRKRRGKQPLLGNHQRCWLWGRHVVLETLKAGRWPILELRFAKELAESERELARALAEELQIPYSLATSEDLTMQCGSQEHQGYLAKMPPYPYEDLHSLEKRWPACPLFLLLDGIQDPYNFGAILRSAEVLGANAVVIGTQHQAGISSQVARSSAGAVNHLPIIQEADLSQVLRNWHERGLRIMGASEKAKTPIHEADFTKPLAFLIGNEGTGIRPELLAMCDDLVTIPQAGRVESLNAAVSAGILLYEVARQRRSICEQIKHKQRRG
jgi:23S rRNA (guanosine2251-2'-O)-methyltransferase